VVWTSIDRALGLAYLSVAKSYQYVPWLLVVFFVEKMLYGVTWVNWLIAKGKTLPKIASESFLTAVFYSVVLLGSVFKGQVLVLTAASRCACEGPLRVR
jgi:hypothetical protein